LKISSSNTDPVYVYIYDSTGGFMKMYEAGSVSTITVGYYWPKGMYTALAVQGAQKVVLKLLKN
jgi:hypothetical protein